MTVTGVNQRNFREDRACRSEVVVDFGADCGLPDNNDVRSSKAFVGAIVKFYGTAMATRFNFAESVYD